MIRIDTFACAQPATAARRLPAMSAANWCVNADTRSSELRGVRQPAPIHELEGGPYAKAVRVRNRLSGGTTWVGLESPYAELLPSPVLNDAFGRLYRFAPGESPSVTTIEQLEAGGAFYPLAVPYPTVAPTLAVEGTATSNSVYLRETRAYITTFVTEWGEESAPSAPATIDLQPGQRVRVSGLKPSTPPTLGGREWASIRVYRTVVGLGTVEFYRVADVPWDTSEYLDEASAATVVFNTTFSSANDALPDGYWGARQHSSGSLIAFKGNTVRFSVPYLPHAWPSEWQWGFPDDVVAVEPYGQSVVVLTESGVHVMFGSRAPELGMLAFPHPMPCLGYGTVVNTPQGVYFITQDGLALTTGGPPQLVTQGLIERDQWRRSYAREAWAVFDDGYYTALYKDGSGFRIDLLRNTGLSALDTGVPALIFSDRYSGATIAVRGSTVMEFDPPSSPPLPYTWQSGDYYYPTPVNLEAVEVDFDEVTPDAVAAPLNNQVLVRVWADGLMRTEQWVKRRVATNLPKGFKAAVWRVEVYGACPLHYIVLSSTLKGLSNG